MGSGFVKTVPILVDEGDDSGSHGWVDRGLHVKALVEFGLIDGRVPLANVGASNGEIGWFAGDTVAVFGEEEIRFVDVVGVLERDVFVSWFWAPNFGWYGNGKGGGDGEGGGRTTMARWEVPDGKSVGAGVGAGLCVSVGVGLGVGVGVGVGAGVGGDV